LNKKNALIGVLTPAFARKSKLKEKSEVVFEGEGSIRGIETVSTVHVMGNFKRGVGKSQLNKKE